MIDMVINGVLLVLGHPTSLEEANILMKSIETFRRATVSFIGTSPLMKEIVEGISNFEGSRIDIFVNEILDEEEKGAMTNVCNDTARLTFHDEEARVCSGLVKVNEHCNVIVAPLTADGIFSAIIIADLNYEHAHSDAQFYASGKPTYCSQWGRDLHQVLTIIEQDADEAQELLEAFLTYVHEYRNLLGMLTACNRRLHNAQTAIEKLLNVKEENKTALAQKGVYVVDTSMINRTVFRKKLLETPELRFVVLRAEHEGIIRYGIFTPENGEKIEERCPTSSDVGMVRVIDDHHIDVDQEAWERVFYPALTKD